MKSKPHRQSVDTPLVLVGSGGRAHARDTKTGGPLCGAWTYNLGDVHASQAVQMTCLRCIRLVVASTTPAQIADLHPQAPHGRRDLYRLVVGGMESANVSKLVPRTSTPQLRPTFRSGGSANSASPRFQPFEEFEAFDSDIEPRGKK